MVKHIEVIDLLSSPGTPPPLVINKAKLKVSKPSRIDKTLDFDNAIDVRSSPRRKAAEAALRRQVESSGQKQRIDDAFGSDQFASSPLVLRKPTERAEILPVLRGAGISALNRNHDFRMLHRRNSNAGDEGGRDCVIGSDPFVSSPIVQKKHKETTEALPELRRAKQPASDKHHDFRRPYRRNSNAGDEETRDDFLGSDPFASTPIVASKQRQTTASAAQKPSYSGTSAYTNVDVLDLLDSPHSALSPALPAVFKQKDQNVVVNKPSRAASGALKGQSDFFFLSDDFNRSIYPEQLPRQTARDSPRKDAGTEKLQGIGNGNARVLKRAASDITGGPATSAAARSKGREGGLKRSKTSILQEDPIIFTSSPDDARVARDRSEKARRVRERGRHIDEDDIFGDEIPTTATSRVTMKASDIFDFENSSDAGLPDICAIAGNASGSTRHTSSRSLVPSRAFNEYTKSKTAEERSREKARAATDKAAAKDAEKKRKQQLKEDKAREKQAAADVAKVNTLRTDKKISTPEMILDLSSGLEAKLINQVKVFMEKLDVEVTERFCSVDNIVRWRRKVEAAYNDEAGHWEPVPRSIKPEKHILCIMKASEFVELATGDEGMDLDSHVLNLKANFGGCEIIYLMEGLTSWMRKNKNIKNRKFADAVRTQMAQETNGEAVGPKRRGNSKKAQEYVDEDMIEDSLLRLQVMHGTLIHHTTATIETAEWVVAFTQHISTIPYKLQRMTLDTAFCMDNGQVKTGDGASDTWVKMLQEVNRITAPIAYGIAAEYPSASALVEAFDEKGGDTSEAKDLLTHLKKSANKDGAFTDREIGKRISRRVWGIFTGMDEESTDV